MSADYLVGIPIIDAEHTEIYEACRDLLDVLQGKPHKHTAQELVALLFASAHFHVRNEEHLIQGWSGFKHHQESHRALMYKIDLLYQAIKNHKADPTRVGYDLELLASFTLEWLNEHLAEDRKFVPYLKDLGY